MTIEEFQLFEAASDDKHEFVAGRVIAWNPDVGPRAMTGGSVAHARMAASLIAAIYPAARAKGCEVSTSDAWLKIGDLFNFYPDVMVCCDPTDNHEMYRTSPCLVVEVFSPSTRDKDQGVKLPAYLALPSLRGYLMIDPLTKWAELHWRQPGQSWQSSEYHSGATIDLPCADVSIALDDLYR
jgi:Uma2 family endonuclease